jgi:ectoine hydroxylase-related dioxygenase (phytanoyl-CoA dioxygenase family)
MKQEKFISQLPPYFSQDDIKLKDFDQICSQQTDLDDYPLAKSVEQNVVIYDGATILDALDDGVQEAAIKSELCRALKDGPGVFVVKGAYNDLSVIDRSTEQFRKIVASEQASGHGKGDHFGKNERIWNVIQKACLADPELFIEYYSNPILAIACEAWLGPYYQISAQMNNVKPSSSAQTVHRDYHLGFQSAETIVRYPSHAQVMSQYLTLQGAISHGDIPLEMGPTLFLPYSHQYEPGYIAYTQDAFINYFVEHKVQLPFGKGDMVFFSPALFHGAGTNTTERDRIANLVQISSAFGRTMETIDNAAMVDVVYPILTSRLEAGTISARQLKDTVSAIADGYSFPTNLDSDLLDGGNAPETGHQLLYRALESKWSLEQLQTAMSDYAKRRRSTVT